MSLYTVCVQCVLFVWGQRPRAGRAISCEGHSGTLKLHAAFVRDYWSERYQVCHRGRRFLERPDQWMEKEPVPVSAPWGWGGVHVWLSVCLCVQTCVLIQRGRGSANNISGATVTAHMFLLWQGCGIDRSSAITLWKHSAAALTKHSCEQQLLFTVIWDRRQSTEHYYYYYYCYYCYYCYHHNYYC